MSDEYMTRGLLKKIINHDKFFGSATITCMVGIIWWAAVTHTQVEGNTTKLIKLELDQEEYIEKVNSVVVTPVINTAQIKVLQDDMAGVKSDINLIKNQLQKKDSSSIKILDMLTYLYNKNKK